MEVEMVNILLVFAKAVKYELGSKCLSKPCVAVEKDVLWLCTIDHGAECRLELGQFVVPTDEIIRLI